MCKPLIQLLFPSPLAGEGLGMRGRLSPPTSIAATRVTATTISAKHATGSYQQSANSTSISTSGFALTPSPSPQQVWISILFFNENLLRRGERGAPAVAGYACVSH